MKTPINKKIFEYTKQDFSFVNSKFQNFRINYNKELIDDILNCQTKNDLHSVTIDMLKYCASKKLNEFADFYLLLIEAIVKNDDADLAIKYFICKLQNASLSAERRNKLMNLK